MTKKAKMKNQIKRITTLVLALVMLLGIGAAGISGIGELKASALDVFSDGAYSYTVSEDGEATITKVNVMSGDVTLPETLGGYPVVFLEENIFPEGNTIKSIYIPASIRNICWNFNYTFTPFSGCDSLEKITVDPDNPSYTADENGVLYNKRMTELYHYPAKSPLKRFSIPSSVNMVKKQAFINCVNLEEIFIPKSVSRISNDGDTSNYCPFASCVNLKKITVEEGNRHLSSDENGILYNADKSVMYKVPPAFEAKEFTVPETVLEISIGAFGCCGYIEQIVVPEGVIAIAGEAFEGCHALKTVKLPASAKTIGRTAFMYNHNLERIDISPDNPIYFSDTNGAFCVRKGEYDVGTAERTMLYFVPQGTKAVNYKIDEGIEFVNANAFSSNFNIESIEIPSSVEEIGSGGFASCPNLKRVVFSDGLKTLGQRAFSYCYSLTEITLPEGLETIGASAFEGCANLKSVNVPASVTSIGYNAFKECKSLESINVAESSESFASVDGVLFTADKTDLKWYPISKTDKVYSIPEGTMIVSNNWDGCEHIEEINVPASVEDFSGGYLPNLKKINVDANNQHMFINEFGYLCSAHKEYTNTVYVCQIPYAAANGAYIVSEGEAAIAPFNGIEEITCLVVLKYDILYNFSVFFSECYNLTDVYYRGSREDWNEIAERNHTESLDELMKEYGITVHFDYQDGDHIHNYGVEVNVAPTCSEKGSSTYTCDCGHSVVKETQPLGHKIADLEWTVQSTVSCSEYGLEILECPDCGISENLIFTKRELKLPHEFSITAIPSTATAAGELTYDCNNCEHVEISEIPAGDKYVIYDVNGKMSAAVYTPGEAVSAPEAPVKEGLDFIGWKDSDGKIFEISTMPDRNVVLKPSFGKQMKDNAYGVSVKFDEDCFAEGYDVDLVIDEVSSNQEQGAILFKENNTTYRAVKLLDIAFKSEGKEIQPQEDKGVEIRIPVPKGYEYCEEFLICHRHGGIDDYETFVVAPVDGYLIFTATKFSEFEIYAKATLSIKTLPAKLSYAYKEALDVSGLALLITDDGGNTVEVTDTSKMKVTGYDPKKVGTQTINVEYEGLKADFNVTVEYTWWQWIIRILLLGFLWY